MSIVIVSPTDSPEAVTAAMGDLATEKTVEAKPVEKEEVDPADTEIEDEAKEVDEELEAKDETKPKKLGGFQKKLAKKDREIENLKRDNELWRQEALRAKPVIETKPEPIKQDLSGMPKENDFATVREYDKALIRWEVRQELLAEKQKAKEESIKTEHQTARNKHDIRVQDFKESTNPTLESDWKDAVKTVGGRFPNSVIGVLIDSEHGPELMQALIDDPEELKKICSMTEHNAAKALGKIESRFEKPSKSSEETKPKTKVPVPVNPVRAKGGTVAKGYRDDMTQREYEEWRKESSAKRA